MKHADVLITSNLQFGFKAKHSTTQCTYVLNELVHCCVNQNTSCYAVLLDASKVLDRVQSRILFKSLLVIRGIC